MDDPGEKDMEKVTTTSCKIWYVSQCDNVNMKMCLGLWRGVYIIIRVARRVAK